MKNILGLDIGTNSIGWAMVQYLSDDDQRPKIHLGSRIIPMSQDVLGDFDKGVTKSQTAERTGYRGVRRLRERCLLRRERLFRVLHVLEFLPAHFDEQIGWDRTDGKTFGKFLNSSEPKIAWRRDAFGKHKFIFMDAFDEMVCEFQRENPQLFANGKTIPLDWTIYYLRHKALTRPVTRQELAWILLNFNQKRGYYQLRGEEEEAEDKSKLVEYHLLKVVDVEETSEKGKNGTWYNIHLENGWVYRRTSKQPLNDWLGLTKEFIVTTELDDSGNVKKDKDGLDKRTFKAPGENDWTLQKKRVEADIDASGMTVGSYIYTALLHDPDTKIKGRLVRTIERKYYKQELHAILKKQAEYINELTSKETLEACIQELYPRNISHQDYLRSKDVAYLLADDILFYQRPLKSKKSLISNCPYEKYEYVDKTTGEIKVEHIKCIAKSNPYYQEFRLRQFVQNLRLFDTEGITETDVTGLYLKSDEDYERLFAFLNERKDIKQDVLLSKFFGLKKPQGKDSKYAVRWNYVEEKTYPCNETRHMLLTALQKANCDVSILTPDLEYRLWHLLYSVEDIDEITKALTRWADSMHLGMEFVEAFKRVPQIKKDYGAYSEKAIKKLLAKMRTGMRLHEACYEVYGCYSEVKDLQRWTTPEQMQTSIKDFKQHSMRNPIVEQCVLETLRTVHDLWVEFGQIDEIHVELGRNMKSTSEQRKRMSSIIKKNEDTNLRIKLLLQEMATDPSIEDVRPHSPMQQEIMRIYEEGALLQLKPADPDFKDISKISSSASPSASELQRYRLWLEQKYRSPYTGKSISLTKLFTKAYEIEHIIPRSRYFDNSLSNKVVCEAEVNLLKSNSLGYEFIKSHKGEIVRTAAHGDVAIFTPEQYEEFIRDCYATNKAKSTRLMMENIPEQFVQRQMNDTRYISRYVMSLLSNVVREEGEEEATAKHLVPCNGAITDKLKQDWGLNDIWSHIIAPRFQRMNHLTSSDAFGHWEDKQGKRVFQTTMPIELQRGFSKKRIDHRHHAMDALVIAMASRSIVAYLNNESAADTKRRYKHKLCGKGQTICKPWQTFTEDAAKALSDIVVSFKNYVRVINKATNRYQHYDEHGKKIADKQKGNTMWAIRQPMHEESVFAHVNLRRKRMAKLDKAIEDLPSIADRSIRLFLASLIAKEGNEKKAIKVLKEREYLFEGRDISMVEQYYMTDDVTPQSAIRRSIDASFTEDRIQKITDTGIQKILLRYLEARGGDPAMSFTPEGICYMNAHIADYNGGKPHKPIYKVRVCEALGVKFAVGQRGNKAKKFVQGAPHLYAAIYADEEGKRSYETLELNVVIERMKQGLPAAPEFNDKGHHLLFILSPHDLVYVPSEEEQATGVCQKNADRIYRFISSENTALYFLPCTIATVIQKKCEFESGNKSEKYVNYADYSDKGMIKAVCWKLEVDRLGNIVRVIK